MSHPVAYTYNEEPEDDLDLEIAWTGGDLHITELGNSLDALARQNEPLNGGDPELSWSRTDPPLDVPASIDTLRNENNDSNLEHLFSVDQSHLLTPAGPPTENESAWPDHNGTFSSAPCPNGHGWTGGSLSFSLTPQNPSLYSNDSTREVIRTGRLHVPAAPWPPLALRSFATEGAHHTGTQILYSAYDREDVTVPPWKPSEAGKPGCSFNGLDLNKNSAYHPESIGLYNSAAARQHRHVSRFSHGHRATPQSGSHLLPGNPIYQQTDPKRCVTMGRSLSSQTFKFVSLAGEEMSRSSSLSQLSTNRQFVTCTVCGRTYKGKYCKRNLRRHEQGEHSEDGPPIYSCKILGCGHTYKRSDALRVHHRKTHSEPYDHRWPDVEGRVKVSEGARDAAVSGLHSDSTSLASRNFGGHYHPHVPS